MFFNLDFLSDGEFLYSIFECIENDVYLHELNVFKEVEKINRHNNKDTINDLLICIQIAINKFYFVPNDNILLITFFKYNSEKNSNCFLLETLLKFFNFEGNFLEMMLTFVGFYILKTFETIVLNKKEKQ